MARVALYTLGCKVNFTETATVGRLLAAQGHAPAAFTDSADVYVINTCSVTDHADRKCRKVVAQALRRNPKARVVIMGCYAQLKPQEIARIPGVDVVLGAAEKFSLPQRLEALLADPKAENAHVYDGPIAQVGPFVPTHSMEERTRAFLKIQDGCDYKCSFCTIPLARGASRSDSLVGVLTRARTLTEAGAREIVVSGVNLGDYGTDQPHTLSDVILALDADPHVCGRLRLSSIEPNLLSDAVLQAVAGSRKWVPHFHIPLQSGSNAILAQMRRRYRAELYAERMTALHELLPHAGVGADVITGFPGETEADFQATYSLLEDLPISYLHAFPYSERASTLAATLPGRLPERVRTGRTLRLRELSHELGQRFRARMLGQVRPVLWEETPTQPQDQPYMLGYTDNYLRVAAPYDPLLVGEVVPTRITAEAVQGYVVGEPTVEALTLFHA